MGKDDATARAADPLEGFCAEVEAKLATADLPGLEAAQEVVESVATSHNAGGIAEFHGLSPADMHTLLTRPFESAAVVQWPQLTGEPSSPVVTLARLLINGIGDGIRATARGNLPQKLVVTAAAEFAATVGSDVIEDYTAARREDEFEPLHVVRLVCELAGLIESNGKRFALTTKCRTVLAENGMGGIYRELLQAYLLDFNWAYRDGFDDWPGIQHTALFTLYLLSHYGSDFRDWDFYADGFLKAFPGVENEATHTWQSARENVLAAYQTRTLKRFAEFFGLAEIRHRDIFSADIKSAPLLDRVVRFRASPADGSRNSTSASGGKVTALNTRTRSEWQGKRVNVGYIETEGRYAVMELWLSLPDGIIVHYSHAAEGAGEVTDSLREAVTTYAPTHLTVHDRRWGATLRAAFPDLDIRIGPTPEVNEAADSLLKSLSKHADGTAPYLTADMDGSTMARLFEDAADVYMAAPWKFLEDWQIALVDVPQLGIKGACVSVIGAINGDYGFLIFNSINGYAAMVESSDEIMRSGGIDVGEDFLSLNYQRGGDLPRAMREEIRRNGWRVANSRAYPTLIHHAADGSPRELTRQDALVLGACAKALTALISQEQHRLKPGEPASFGYTVTDPDGQLIHIYSPGLEDDTP